METYSGKSKKSTRTFWNKGLSKETDERVRIGSEKGRLKKSISHTGKKRSKEHKEAISKSLKGKPKSIAHRKKLSGSLQGKLVGKLNPFYGRKHSAKTRKIMKEKCNNKGKNNPMFGKKRNDVKYGEESRFFKHGGGIYRREALKKLEHKCKKCGIEDIRILLVHHKNRNRKIII